ncbi:MAG: FAD:protein FMN transferase [Rhodocyclaceae bacterium]|nr:FAD:protein FMN transferase [Rhodocyclaceae bacterium]
MRRFLILAALLLAACQPAPKIHSQESYVFGTRVEVLVWGEPADKAREAVAEVLREFDRLHRTYHAWQPSELTALNDAIAAGRRHEVAPELAQFAREAQEFSARGDHLFDPGVGALVKLWGFHDDSFRAQLPDPAALAKLVKARPSIADLTITGNTVSSGNPAVALDFGGYLKGVALDHAIDILWRYGISNALVNIGGNVMALGSKGGAPWRVGIQSPRATTPLATLDLKDGEAIGTSGDYQRYFELDGRRYSHLLDPRSGQPAAGSQAVTVLITPRPRAGMWSDWASKPIFIAGAGWRDMAQKLGITHVLRVDAAGKVEVTDELRPRLTMGPGS